MRSVNRLTRKERIVLATVLGLFLVGWAVRTARQDTPPPAAGKLSEP
jgi:hypothetical protein